MTDTPPAPSDPASGMGIWMAMLGCAFVGLAINSVLAWETHQLNETGRSTGLPGCSGGVFDCGSVLTSPYGRIGDFDGSGGGTSVTYLAFGFYAAVIAMLAFARPNRPAGPRLIPLMLLPVLGSMGLATGAWAAWAMVKLREVCPWCVAVHAVNLVLFFLAVGFTQKFWLQRKDEGRDEGFANRVAWMSGFACLGVIAFQMTLLMKFHDAELLFDPTAGDFPSVTLEGDPREQIIWSEIGNHESDNIVVMFSCFTCPRCKEAHEALDEVLRKHPGEMRLQLRFNPLAPACNPQIQPPASPEHQFACPLAVIGLAVAEADQAAFGDFARWLYANQEGMTPLAAEAEARQRVKDIAAFDQALDEETEAGKKIQQRLRNDVDLATAIKLRSVPQIFMRDGQLRGVITTEKVERLLGRAFGWERAASE